MTLYTHEQGYPDNEYEVVDVIPQGYSVWNIGSHAPEGYLPLCRLKAIQPFDGCRMIETDTLKAVKTEGTQQILLAASHGYDTVEKMQKCVIRHPHTRDAELCRKALPFMEAITTTSYKN